MGEIINPLVSTREVLSRVEKVKQEAVLSEVTSSEKHEFFISAGYKLFASALTKISQETHYTFVSFGQWSLKHVIFHIVKLIGKCDIYSTTYGLGPSSARGIVTALGKGMISSFNFLYDNKIRTYKIEAHDICVSNFPVSLASIHAKVTVLINDKYAITVTGSANWSDSNDKIEITEINTNRGLASFHKKWITQAMQSKNTNPKKILSDLQQG